MARQSIPFKSEAIALAAALFLAASTVLAGGRVTAPSRTYPQSYSVAHATAEPAPAPLVRFATGSVSVVVTPPARVKEEVFITLRGPDGKLRRFPVEGGRAAIQVRQLVLQPGQSVTIQLVTK